MKRGPKPGPQTAEVLRLTLQGKSRKEIAAVMHLSLSTVGWHLRKLFVKYKVEDHRQLMALFIGQAEVPPIQRPTHPRLTG